MVIRTRRRQNLAPFLVTAISNSPMPAVDSGRIGDSTVDGEGCASPKGDACSCATPTSMSCVQSNGRTRRTSAASFQLNSMTEVRNWKNLTVGELRLVLKCGSYLQIPIMYIPDTQHDLPIF